MTGGSGNGGHRISPRLDRYSVRFRKTDGIQHGSLRGPLYINRRRKNGIIRDPIVRPGDPAERRAEIVGMRNCVVQAKEIPQDLIVKDTLVVPEGEYEETCDYYYISKKDENVNRARELKGDRFILPFRILFLEYLCFTDCAQEIFLRSEESPDSNIRRQDREMVGYMSMLDALNVADLINLNLKGNYRVRVASELLVSAFLHNGGYEHCGREGVYLTANHFLYDPLKHLTSHDSPPKHISYLESLRERAIDGRIINNRKSILLKSEKQRTGYHAFIYRTVSTAGKLEVQRWGQGADSWMNCSVLFEVYQV